MDLNWTKDLAVGHEIIDIQHQTLFEKFNDFLEGCNERQAPEKLERLLDFLQLYVDEHFRAEESLMEEMGYHHFEEHRREHRNFQEMVEKLREQLHRDGPTVEILIRTTKGLINWLTGHIREVDSEFARYAKGSQE